MKKAVFFDLDGTLLNSKKEILPENIEAIKRAMARGIEVVLCSGRNLDDILKYVEQVGASRYVIYSNGTVIYDREEKETLFESILDKNFCIKLYEHAQKNGMLVRLDTKYGRFINLEKYKINNNIMLEEDYKKFFDENNILQITLGSKDSSKIDEIQKMEKDNPNVEIANRFISGMLPEELDMIEYVNKGTSKGNAICGLCKYLKVDLKDAVAFGDDLNDISMLEAVGHGVAMGNAFDEVKAVASEVISNNNEPGIAKVLDNLDT